MANTPQDFRQHHLTRALRAARAAGMDSVKVRLPSGVEFHIGGGVVPEAPPKKSMQKSATLAEGGSTRMHPPQAANPQRPGRTAHAVKGAAPGSQGASGGAAKFGPSSAAPAKAGQVGTDSVKPVGGLARAARPGQCGT
jgi:hypothetical protein